ncbi:MAG: hypothetical protein M1826_005782 [Phylliscum demangeonii]|nr:MAG: hypothetical protein M1826_005782 [Phylliscum demangeonii]
MTTSAIATAPSPHHHYLPRRSSPLAPRHARDRIGAAIHSTAQHAAPACALLPSSPMATNVPRDDDHYHDASRAPHAMPSTPSPPPRLNHPPYRPLPAQLAHSNSSDASRDRRRHIFLKRVQRDRHEARWQARGGDDEIQMLRTIVLAERRRWEESQAKMSRWWCHTSTIDDAEADDALGGRDAQMHEPDQLLPPDPDEADEADRDDDMGRRDGRRSMPYSPPRPPTFAGEHEAAAADADDDDDDDDDGYDQIFQELMMAHDMKGVVVGSGPGLVGPDHDHDRDYKVSSEEQPDVMDTSNG